MVTRDRKVGGSEVSREKEDGRHFVLAQGCCKEKAMEDPKDLYPGLAARPASGQFLPPIFFTAPFNSASFPVALGGLTANASLDCLCFAEVYVDREVRRLISFLNLYLVFC